MQLVTEETVEAFARDGAACIRQAFSADELALLERGIEQNLASPSERALVASRPDDPGRFFEDFCNWQRVPEYEQFIRESPAAEIAAQLMRSRHVRLFHDHLLVKESATRQPTPWHQDQPYYNVDGTQVCSVWLPIDPVDRESTLEFVAGTHLGPWLMPRTFMAGEAKWFPEGSLEELPDIDANRDAFRILAWALEPGDAVFFHMLTLHAAGGATRRRRAFSIRFLGDDAVHSPRPWKTSPDFPDLDDELAAGAEFDHRLFPRLWPRDQVPSQ
jgi:ectoine hydroxylase-related dioxygenase (phytanoyl-CoA dioxygenase family)